MDEKDNKIREEYVNALSVNNSFFDFSFSFQKENIYEKEGQQIKETEEAARVRMSPQMAKALALLLTKHVEEYEKTYGRIPTLGEKEG